jgi:hypothetical protein
MTKTRDLADLGGGFIQAGTGAQQRTVESKLQDVVSVLDFIPESQHAAIKAGTSTYDATADIQAAIDSLPNSDTATLLIPSGASFLVNTFSNVLTDGTSCAFKLTKSLRIAGQGAIKSTTSAVSNSIFGVDSTDGSIALSLSDIKFQGTSRYRIVQFTPLSVTKSILIKNVVTEAQSLVLLGQVNNSLDISDCVLGNNITAATNLSPSFIVILPEGSNPTQSYLVSNNTVRTGTEVISSGAFVLHGIPVGGTVVDNAHYNLGAVANEGFDIDNIGTFAKICRNLAWKSGFEYKTGTDGYSNSRDIIFSENISYEAVGTGITLQSSCSGSNNIVYNPAVWGLFLSPTSDVDGLLTKANLHINGIRIIYAGASWNGAVRLSTGVSTGYRTLTIRDLSIELDPAWDAANPVTSIPGQGFDIDGDASNLTLSNIRLNRLTGDGVKFRPSTTASNIRFENFHWIGDAGDSCFDLSNCNDVQILNPVFPATITDRPIRLSTCARVRVQCEYKSSVLLAITSGSNTGVLINNYSIEAAGIGNPPTATSTWPIGAIVQNTDDSTVWIRITESATPTSAWKQLA